MVRRGGSGGYNANDVNMMPTYNPVTAAANLILSHENNYRQNVGKIQASALFLAEKLCKGQQIETALSCSTAPAEENAAFLEEQRTLLKDIAAANVVRNREISWFLRSVKEMSDDAMRAASNEDDDGGTTFEVPNFALILEQKMEACRNERSAVEVDICNEKFCKDIRSRLGEKEPKKKNVSKKGGRRSASGDETDDDEELEIMNEQSQANEEMHVKCPITCATFERPLKSKVCNHTYSTAGLEQMIKCKKYKCPVPGCTNHHLSMQQVEPDVEMEMRVKRFQRRKEQEENKRRRILEEDDEDEAEFDVQGDVKTTVIS